MPVITPPSAGGSGTTVTGRRVEGPLGGITTLGNSTTITTFALNASGRAVASAFGVASSQNITHVGVYVTAATGTPQGTVRVVTLDSSGNPTTTDYGSSAGGTFTPSVGWHWVALATPATATPGDRVAARVDNTSADATVTPFTVQQHAALIGNAHLPNSQSLDSATWTKSTSRPLVCVKHADGQVRGGTPLAATSVVGSNLSSATDPDEIGMRFPAPVSGLCVGAQLMLDPSAVTDTDTVRLLDTAHNVLASGSIGAGDNTSANVGLIDVYWTTPYALVRGTTYRLTVLATTTGNRTLRQVTVPASADRSGLAGGEQAQLTSRLSSGTTWTDTDTIVPLMGVWMTTLEAF